MATKPKWVKKAENTRKKLGKKLAKAFKILYLCNVKPLRFK